MGSMPVHNWSRVNPGVAHDFHVGWITSLQRVLNRGVLPSAYYALIEPTNSDGGATRRVELGGSASDFTALAAIQAEQAQYAVKRHRIVIRCSTGDRVIALVEMTSQGDKLGCEAIEAFVDQMVAAIERGYHLLVIDLLPPGPFDPSGIHGAIWGRLGESYAAPPGKPLTLAAYATGGRGDAPVTCYVEPTAVGSALIDMPLFLDPGHYVNTPLEQTYLAAYDGVPERWRRVIEGRG